VSERREGCSVCGGEKARGLKGCERLEWSGSCVELVSRVCGGGSGHVSLSLLRVAWSHECVWSGVCRVCGVLLLPFCSY